MNLGAIGKGVRIRRAELNLTQKQLAKKASVAVGTLQQLERAEYEKRPRQTSPENLQKIAKALGRSIEQLSQDEEAVKPSDPLRAGLNREDYEIARAYHDAATDVRQRARVLLYERERLPLSDDIAARAAALANTAAQLDSDNLEIVEQLVASLKDRQAPTQQQRAAPPKPKPNAS